MGMRRYSPIPKSRGTVWPPEVRAHVREHQSGCIGPLAGMLGHCDQGIELDHIRASHGTGMKSDSIATNAAQLCGWHHRMKTDGGKTWRPRLIDVVRSLTRGCDECEAEHLAYYGAAVPV